MVGSGENIILYGLLNFCQLVLSVSLALWLIDKGVHVPADNKNKPVFFLQGGTGLHLTSGSPDIFSCNKSGKKALALT